MKQKVSIHAPAWGATRQNVLFDWDKRVSIHAPAWGATLPSPYDGTYHRVSIHAPAWGATPTFPSVFVENSGFNPRARVGRDSEPKIRPSASRSFNPRARVGRDLQDLESTVTAKVSIHAPAWGATKCA